MASNRRVALVTGAGSGIGREIAKSFVSEGLSVLGVDLDGDGLGVTAEEVGGAGSAFAMEVADIGEPGAGQRLADRAVAAFGRLDILINNAGIGVQKRALETTREDFERIFRVNVFAAFELSQAAAVAMIEQGPSAGFGAGRIVNLVSIAGQRGMRGRAAYGGSKAALIQQTKLMAVELAEHAITVNAVAPGPIETPMIKVMHNAETRAAFLKHTPLGYYGRPEDIAAAVAFLASEAAGYITGHVLNVDGGFNAYGMSFEL